MGKLASEKLKRYGFNPERRCLLPVVCKHLLIKIPGKDEVFACVDQRDRMHGAFIFIHRSLTELFIKMRLSGAVKKILDQRITKVCLEGGIRHPITNRSYRVQNSIFSETNMSTSDRVCVIFLLPHILGHEARILPQEIRYPVLKAIAIAQQIIIAMRDGRAYTERELQLIFDDGYIELCRHFETIYAVSSNKRYRYELDRHQRNPAKYTRPKRFQRRSRCVQNIFLRHLLLAKPCAMPVLKPYLISVLKLRVICVLKQCLISGFKNRVWYAFLKPCDILSLKPCMICIFISYLFILRHVGNGNTTNRRQQRMIQTTSVTLVALENTPMDQYACRISTGLIK